MRRRRFGTLALFFGLALTGCSSSSNNNDTTGSLDAGGDGGETHLDVFSWWTAPGEAEALHALIDTYKASYPTARVSIDAEGSSADWHPILNSQVEHAPWDAFQMSASDLPQFTSDHPGAVAPVDDIYNEPSLQSAGIPEILKAPRVGDHAYGVVTGVHRNDAFLYNHQILQAQGLTPPTTVTELLAVCTKLKAAGFTPFAASFEGWALRIMFDDLLAGTIGAEGFAHLADGTTPTSDPNFQTGLRSAIDTFDKILTNFVDPASKADTYKWTDAAEALHSEKAVMYFHGDWAKGYLTSLGWRPGVDFSVSGPPGASDLFVYGADTFAMPASAPHQQMAKEFLAIVASKEGQIAFNKYKGSTPMRMDVRDQLDAPGQLNLDNLVNAKVRMRGHTNYAWDQAIAQFGKDFDKEALFQVYITMPP